MESLKNNENEKCNKEIKRIYFDYNLNNTDLHILRNCFIEKDKKTISNYQKIIAICNKEMETIVEKLNIAIIDNVKNFNTLDNIFQDFNINNLDLNIISTLIKNNINVDKDLYKYGYIKKLANIALNELKVSKFKDLNKKLTPDLDIDKKTYHNTNPINEEKPNAVKLKDLETLGYFKKEEKKEETINKPPKKELESYIVKQEDLIDKIKGYPIEVVQKMVDNQVLQGEKPNVKIFQNNPKADISKKGFGWSKSKEGFVVWVDTICMKDFTKFYELYPKKRKKEKVNKPLELEDNNKLLELEDKRKNYLELKNVIGATIHNKEIYVLRRVKVVNKTSEKFKKEYYETIVGKWEKRVNDFKSKYNVLFKGWKDDVIGSKGLFTGIIGIVNGEDIK